MFGLRKEWEYFCKLSAYPFTAAMHISKATVYRNIYYD